MPRNAKRTINNAFIIKRFHVGTANFYSPVAFPAKSHTITSIETSVLSDSRQQSSHENVAPPKFLRGEYDYRSQKPMEGRRTPSLRFRVWFSKWEKKEEIEQRESRVPFRSLSSRRTSSICGPGATHKNGAHESCACTLVPPHSRVSKRTRSLTDSPTISLYYRLSKHRREGRPR